MYSLSCMCLKQLQMLFSQTLRPFLFNLYSCWNSKLYTRAANTLVFTVVGYRSSCPPCLSSSSYICFWLSNTLHKSLSLFFHSSLLDLSTGVSSLSSFCLFCFPFLNLQLCNPCNKLQLQDRMLRGRAE